uniref:Uncharacterized protein n=1 Tax=Rhizobium rhizogenes TaxID=359 RepID=A0A7S4ZRQ7_RHIRH|nr:hypothetical protein pC5.8a_201 [Rhizobium rhizogenes]QCL10330.1 hypothetical protein pC6.5b_436 [Rhizobium rhizogenes]QCL10485.1 hypothetical protein pC6.5c_592 [Rhizobium rhizogenes]
MCFRSHAATPSVTKMLIYIVARYIWGAMKKCASAEQQRDLETTH